VSIQDAEISAAVFAAIIFGIIVLGAAFFIERRHNGAFPAWIVGAITVALVLYFGFQLWGFVLYAIDPPFVPCGPAGTPCSG
jgi:Na+/proline symporter